MAKKKGCLSTLLIIALLLVGIGAIVAYYAYNYVFSKNINSDQAEIEFYIPTDATFQTVLDSLEQKQLLKHKASFRQIAKAKKYPDLVKPGKYILQNNWTNLELVDHLRAGKQEPVKMIINNTRTLEELAGRVGKTIEADSLTVLTALRNPETAKKYGFTKETFPAMFLANTYQVYWNTTPDQFFQRMQKEYNKFWTPKRLEKAKAIGLTKEEVISLAAIVEEETKSRKEIPIVAGLYLNRLKKGMLLQSDPTVKYAVGDFTIRRVLSKHLEKDSPYNTYKYTGLTPGPIRIPELNVVEGVLNPATHNYLYMCAKPDFSGEHAFAKTLSEHNRNSSAYHRALNQRGIYK